MKAKPKFKVINTDYVYAGDGKLVKFSHASDKPWHVYGIGVIREFRTHAEAINHAHKHARKGNK